MVDVPQPLNLIKLTQGGGSQSVPAMEARVMQLLEPEKLETSPQQWFLVLKGELIIDLPHGDFRILRVGDFLSFASSVSITLTPVDAVTLLSS